MYEEMSEIIWAEHQRRMTWINEHAWKYEHMRAARRSWRINVAEAFRAIAERIAPAAEPATAEPAAQQS